MPRLSAEGRRRGVAEPVVQFTLPECATRTRIVDLVAFDPQRNRLKISEARFGVEFQWASTPNSGRLLAPPDPQLAPSRPPAEPIRVA